MRGKEFLDKMELIDPAYVEAAEVKAPKKRTFFVKWGAMAACLCFVAAGVMLMPGMWNTTEPPVYVPETDAFSVVPEETAQQENELAADPVETQLAETTIEPATEPYFIDMYNGICIGIGHSPNDRELPPGKNMISAYGESPYVENTEVPNGSVCFSEALQAAMEEYGETVNYRVLVELFCDGERISSGGELALREAERLSDLGYIVAMETHTETVEDGEIVTARATYFFTLHATYDQLKSFLTEDTLGYSMVLYGEYFGMTLPFDLPIYNGSFEAVSPREAVLFE